MVSTVLMDRRTLSYKVQVHWGNVTECGLWNTHFYDLFMYIMKTNEYSRKSTEKYLGMRKLSLQSEYYFYR